MAAGTGGYFLAIAGNIILTIIAFILFKTNFGSIVKSEFILQFRIKNRSNFNRKYTLLYQNSQNHRRF